MSSPGSPPEELIDIFENATSLHRSLPELPPQFFIPRLSDKPQNPIMDTLRLIRGAQPPKPAESMSLRLPLELELLSEDVARFADERQVRLENLWQMAATEKHGRKNQVLSWDALRPSYSMSVATQSPFLSEQSSGAFASARYYLRPPIKDRNVHLVYAHVPELLESLFSTVSGTSSHFHIWDPVTHKFVLRDLDGKERGQIVIVSKDEIVGNSLLQRFLTIGNLMRRLEVLADSRETKYTTAVTHAFTHSLSSILAYVREISETIPLRFQTSSREEARLTALWIQYEDIELILKALAALCGRSEDVLPPDYPPIPSTPTALLSTVYEHLSDHIERSSPRIVCAVLAFVLTTTSRSYFQSLCASVGYNIPGSSSRAPQRRRQVPSDWPGRPLEALVDDENTNVWPEDPDDDMMDGFPDFIPADTAEVLSRARKSLVLLRAADSGHPVLNSNNLHQEIGWVWTEEQIDNTTEGAAFGETTSQGRKTQAIDKASSHLTSGSNVLDTFKVFDLSPGQSLSDLTATAPNILSNAYATAPLRAFLEAFPATLPSSTPTLAHLTAHTLSPLVSHASTLSGALVAHLLASATPLHLYTHLALLRGYLLLTTHAFKWRLQDALFSDAEEVSAPVVGSRTYAAQEAGENPRERRRAESGRSKSRAASVGGREKAKAKTDRRAIGLSPALTVGDRWPPGGTDLNFHLRTVIVDSLEEGRLDYSADEEVEDEGPAKAQRQIMEEAEWRLGFAIRDLPFGTGKERWFNPLSIEALDFLYMHYQPPHPLDVIITPATLSKYHRMFAFNLRLMRVENTVRTLFRMTCKASVPLFPTLTPTNKRLLHFRFVAHAFITALSSYVYDVAIGSNMDAFLSRLTLPSTRFPPVDADARPLRTSALEHEGGDREFAGFADVFGLAEHHSRVLDDILSSCLLRSGQKAVGDILRRCMELVLELGILAGDLKDGHLEEYEAAPALEELWERYRTKMTTFVKVLKALVEKEADSSGLVLSDIPLHMMQGHKRVSGTTANLHQLLLRLNMSDWWTK
ncbi:Spc98 family-domain-containing protein [Trametes maxima]|nr:Spc98 family-domain-containing protein [Trametes maxima]